MRSGLPAIAGLPLVALLALTTSVFGQWNRRPYQASRYGGNYLHAYLIPPAPSSTPWAPAWSPDGRALAVAISGSIWRVDVVSGAAVELTAGSAYHSSPTWSPDGRWIAYTADDGGTTVQLEALEVHSGDVRVLTSGKVLYLDPQFSPDGSQLAYAATLPSGFLNVFVQPFRDGALAGEPVQVTVDGRFSTDRPYFTPQDMHITPAWLANGRELMLVSNRGVALGSGRYREGPGGTSRHREGRGRCRRADLLSGTASGLSRRDAARLRLLPRRHGAVESPGGDRPPASVVGGGSQRAAIATANATGQRRLRRVLSTMGAGRKVDRLSHEREQPARDRDCGRRQPVDR